MRACTRTTTNYSISILQNEGTSPGRSSQLSFLDLENLSIVGGGFKIVEFEFEFELARSFVL